VGDSRAYLLRGEQLTQLTNDHTIVQLQVDWGMLSPAEACAHPMRNVLWQSLGTDSLLRPEIRAVDLQPGDRILLTTDGVTGTVDEQELVEVAARDESPESIAQTLVSIAHRNGSSDDATCLVILTGLNDPGRDGTIVE
jgi:protein phosphatase